MNSFMNEIETIFQISVSDDTWFCQDIIKLPNRAMSFGDGLFETMLWDGQSIRFFARHLKRLMAGMEVLGLDVSMINSAKLNELLILKFPKERKRIRWTVYRAGGGKYTPEVTGVIQLLQVTPATLVPPIRKQADVSKDVRLFSTSWSKFKTLNSIPYILANKERSERGLDELILLDHRGFISEGSISNIFWVKSGTFYTPSISCGCIEGVSRQELLETLEKSKFPFEVGEFNLSALDDAEQVFFTNSSGVSYLGNFQNRRFATTPIRILEQIFD